MSESEEEQHTQSSDLPRTGYEAAEEERRSLEMEEEERNPRVASLEEEEEEEEPAAEPTKQQKRDETKGKRRRNTTTAIGVAASAWQVTLFDLGKQLNRQRMLMERMAEDIKHLRKQFNQVQRDLAKFEKRMEKMKTTTSSSTKIGKRRG
jgi:chromosome segregation ATPase